MDGPRASLKIPLMCLFLHLLALSFYVFFSSQLAFDSFHVKSYCISTSYEACLHPIAKHFNPKIAQTKMDLFIYLFTLLFIHV